MGLVYPLLPTGRSGASDPRAGALAWRHVDLDVLARALPPGAVAPVSARADTRLVWLDRGVVPFLAALDGAVTVLPDGPFETPAGPRGWSDVRDGASPGSGLAAWLARTLGPLGAEEWPAGVTVLAHVGLDTALVAFAGDLRSALAGRPAFRGAAPLPPAFKGGGGVGPGLRLDEGPDGAVAVRPVAVADARDPAVVVLLPSVGAALAGRGAAEREGEVAVGPWDGAGQVVAVADDGLDPVADLTGALAVVEDHAGEGGGDGPAGHGTHVAGLLVGARTGRVPGARLVFQAIGRAVPGRSGRGARAPDPRLLADALESAWARGARVHVDAWAGAAAAFDLAAHAVDAACWARPDLVVVAAAGNRAGSALDGVRSPALARSALAVGALDADRPWPPTCVGAPQDRPKPEVWAPGTGLRSTVPAAADTTGYAAKSGTSGAAAQVGAAAVQVRQWLEAHGHPSPSSALVRALLAHAAAPVDGLPAGFGALDLAFLEADPPEHRDVEAVAQGHVRRYRLAVVPGRAVRVTLAWTDPPARVPFGGEAQSRLRLVVREPRARIGPERCGDDRHPLQRLEVVPRGDRLTVEVHALRVAGVGDPVLSARRQEAPQALRLPAGEPVQDYALVADGALG